MCKNLPDSVKCVPIPLGDGLCLLVVPPKNQSKMTDVEGIRFMKKGGKILYTSLEKAVTAGALDCKKKEEVSQQVYGELLCTESCQTSFDHPLSGKFVVRRWVDHCFKVRTVFGKVVACWRVPHRTGDIRAEIEYTDPSLSFSRRMASAWTMNSRDKISESLAWGSYLLFSDEHCSSDTTIVPSNTVPEKWLVPDSVDDFPDFHRRELTFKNIIIELERRMSDIGSNAGYGVFCRVKPMIRSAKPQKYFVLPQGEYIDLGIYGPLRCDDVIGRTEMIVKSFVLDSKPDEWTFDKSIEDTGEYYDMTENVTGNLHELARRNVLVYVNETDGKEPATVQAFHDPFLHAHYLLGSCENELKLAFGTWCELKVNYGEGYEKIRILKGYSRLKGEALEKKKDDIREDDTLLDMQQWSVDDLESSLKFLERLDYDAVVEVPPKIRALVMTISLRNCLVKIKTNFKNVDTTDPSTFCDNGFSKLESRHLIDRTNGLISRILVRLSGEEVRKGFTGDDLGIRFVSPLAEFLQVPNGSLFSTTGTDLRSKILENATCSV